MLEAVDTFEVDGVTVTVSVITSGCELVDRVMVLKVVGTKSVTVTVFSGVVEVLEDSAGTEAIVVADVCVDESIVRVVWAVSVNVGVIVTVINPSDAEDSTAEPAELELATGVAPPRALPTVASSQQPICTPATVSIGRA